MFSIVPFDGVYKSNRRPIYIECRGDAIILQPEGIVFTPEDFLGPPGPGNPLASALRAAQEYWSQLPPPAPDVNNEPYPLLLVRPDGIIAYYLVRDAMASWNTEFGYELISADGKLEFPAAPEPRLVDMEKRAVAEARQRLQWLAQVSPEAFQHKQKTQYRVSAIRGGLVRDGAPSLGNDPFANDPLGGFGKSAAGRSSGNGSTGYGPGRDSSGSGGNTVDGNMYRGGNGDVPSELRSADVRGNRGLGGSGYGPGNGSGDYGAGGYSPDGYGGNGSTGLGADRYAVGSGGPGGGDHVFSSGGNGNDALGAGGTGRALGGTAGLSGSGAGNGLGEGSLVGPRYSQSGGGLNSQGSNGGGASNPAGGGSPQLSGTQLGGPQLGGPAGANSFGTTGGNFNGASANGAGQFSGGASPGGNGSFSTSGDMAARGPGNASAGSPSGGGSKSEGDSSSCDGSCASGGGSSGGSASASSSSMSQSGMSSGAESSQTAAGIPSPSLNFNANQQRTSRKLANERGRNWAIQNNTNASVPITRPIRIECWNDRLILVPDARDQQPQVIPLADRTDEAVDQLVAAVRVHTQGLGPGRPQHVLETAIAVGREAQRRNRARTICRCCWPTAAWM